MQIPFQLRHCQLTRPHRPRGYQPHWMVRRCNACGSASAPMQMCLNFGPPPPDFQRLQIRLVKGEALAIFSSRRCAQLASESCHLPSSSALGSSRRPSTTPRRPCRQICLGGGGQPPEPKGVAPRPSAVSGTKAHRAQLPMPPPKSSNPKIPTERRLLIGNSQADRRLRARARQS